MATTSDYRIAALVESNRDTSNNGISYRSIVFREFNPSLDPQRMTPLRRSMSTARTVA